MISEKETGLSLVRRLLAGEGRTIAMYLALLLERSSALHREDNHYREVLPPDLSDTRFSSGTVKEIVSTICSELCRNPDEAYMAALSTVGSDEVVSSILAVLLAPPRGMTVAEVSQALGILNTFLPSSVARNAEILPTDQHTRFMEILKNTRGYAVTLERDATQLFMKLSRWAGGPG